MTRCWIKVAQNVSIWVFKILITGNISTGKKRKSSEMRKIINYKINTAICSNYFTSSYKNFRHLWIFTAKHPSKARASWKMEKNIDRTSWSVALYDPFIAMPFISPKFRYICVNLNDKMLLIRSSVSFGLVNNKLNQIVTQIMELICICCGYCLHPKSFST